MNKLGDLHEELQHQADELNEATAELNHTLQVAERVMAWRWPNRAAAVELADGKTLVFCRHKGAQRLLVLNEAGVAVLLTQAARAIRIAVVPALWQLSDQLTYEDEPRVDGPTPTESP